MAQLIPKEGFGIGWRLDEIKQLGKITDTLLVSRTGRTIKEVAAEREARRIGLPTGPRRWTAREIRQPPRSRRYCQ